MVYLSRIYTKTGDDGTTGLGDGSRVAKDCPRVECYGDVDELNAVVGVLRLHVDDAALGSLLENIANDLFDLGADLCVPQGDDEMEKNALRIVDAQVARLERAIDGLNESLAPLSSFVLPGGTPPAAYAHLARTVCRRAERRLVALTRTERVNPAAAMYLNRLSDLLFVLARRFNEDGKLDRLWIPAKNR